MAQRKKTVVVLAALTASAGMLVRAGICYSVPADPKPLPPPITSVHFNTEPTPPQLFEQRIMPIFRSPNPSSCTQCHLSAIDLKNYILPSHEKTFLSLRDRGMIDLDKPAESKILQLIQRGHDDNQGAALIHAKARDAEYQAFAAWIAASAKDPKLRHAPKLTADEAAEEGLQFVAAVQNAGQTDKLLATFLQTVWARRNQCANCHMPGGQNNAKSVAKYGVRVNWMSPQGPAATLKYLGTTKLIDTKEPERSLLLLKPLNEAEHGGGQKIKKGDDCYKDFVTFLKAYAAAAEQPAADTAKTTDKAKPAAPPPEAKKFVELSVQGLKTVDDNFKLRAALSQVREVKSVVIDRKPSGPSSVRVMYTEQEPDVKALLEAVTKSGFKGTKATP